MTQHKPDHGGGMDAAMAQYGGARDNWLDLSTGINPTPYPIPDIPPHYWQVLPDDAAMARLLAAARRFWNVPDGAQIVPASGVSTLIAMLPNLAAQSQISILNPTYNEYAGAFQGAGWAIQDKAPVQVRVHPNNPDGRVFTRAEIAASHDHLTIIDESFCDVCPENSLIALAQSPDHIVLKGMGKFWGLAGLRLGFAIAAPDLAHKITQQLGPWSISGPAQFIGQKALADMGWAIETRARLHAMAGELRDVLVQSGLAPLGGTDLFQLAETTDAKALQAHLCRNHILTRIFPYSQKWIRLGLPENADALGRLRDALRGF
ncbi:MAG: pyridoxal phosphate-dependent class II aminotransferase [Rhodobacterales bacterium]